MLQRFSLDKACGKVSFQVRHCLLLCQLTCLSSAQMSLMLVQMVNSPQSATVGLTERQQLALAMEESKKAAAALQAKDRQASRQTDSEVCNTQKLDITAPEPVINIHMCCTKFALHSKPSQTSVCFFRRECHCQHPPDNMFVVATG